MQGEWTGQLTEGSLASTLDGDAELDLSSSDGDLTIRSRPPCNYFLGAVPDSQSTLVHLIMGNETAAPERCHALANTDVFVSVPDNGSLDVSIQRSGSGEVLASGRFSN